MEEILIKYKVDMDSLNSDYQEIIKQSDRTIQAIESKQIKPSFVDDLKQGLKLINQEAQKLGFGNLEKEIDGIVMDTAKLQKLIESLSASMKGMKSGTTEFKALDSIIQSANKQLATLTQNTEKSGTTIRTQMRQATAEVQNLANKYGLLDKRTVEAAKKAAMLRDTVGDAQGLIQAFNPDTKFQGLTNALQGSVGAFTAVQGAMALVGSESEDLQKTLVRVNGAIALSTGIAQLQQSKDAFIALQAQAVATFQAIRAQIGLTGIGAIALAIGAIAYNWDKVKAAISGVSVEAQELAELAKKDIEIQDEKIKQLNNQDEILKLQGKSEREILELKRANLKLIHQQKAEDIKRILETKILEFNAFRDREKYITKALTGGNVSRISPEMQARIDELNKLTEETRTQLTEMKNSEAKIQNEIISIDKKSADERSKNAKERLKEIQEANKAYFDEFEKDQKLRGKIEFADDYYSQIEKVKAENDKYFKEFGEDSKLVGQYISADEYYKKAEENEKKLQSIRDANEKQFETLSKGRIQTFEDYEKEKAEILKSQIQELSDYAKNGILLNLGINPASVDRIKLGIENTLAVFKNELSSIEQKWGAGAQLASDAYFAVSDAIRNNERQATQRELEELNAQQEEELRLAGENEQKKEIIRQKYDLKKREIKRREAEADKRKAIFDATVSAAAQVAKVLATPWMIPIVLALGATQIALIASTPIPKFEKGGQVPDGLLDGKPHSAGGVPLIAEGGEYIVNKRETAKNMPLLEAINEGKLREHLDAHIIAPEMRKRQSEWMQSENKRRVEEASLYVNKAMSDTMSSFRRENNANMTRLISKFDKSKTNL